LNAKVEQLTSQQSRKSELEKVFLVIVAAVIVFSPGYVSRILLHRSNLGLIAIVPIALALFLIGVFLLLRVSKE